MQNIRKKKKTTSTIISVLKRLISKASVSGFTSLPHQFTVSLFPPPNFDEVKDLLRSLTADRNIQGRCANASHMKGEESFGLKASREETEGGGEPLGGKRQRQR